MENIHNNLLHEEYKSLLWDVKSQSCTKLWIVTSFEHDNAQLLSLSFWIQCIPPPTLLSLKRGPCVIYFIFLFISLSNLSGENENKVLFFF